LRSRPEPGTVLEVGYEMLAIPLYDDTPRIRLPLATGSLVGACSLVFLWQTGLPPRAAMSAMFSYGMIPEVLFGNSELPARLRVVPHWLTPITSQFLHGDLLHLLGNMIYLWVFGRGVEVALGSARYLVLYLACGVAAALTQALVEPASQIPMIGASGAIAGVLGAYLILNPRGNIVVFVWFFIFVRLISLPAILLLGLWFLLQLASGLSATPGQPGIAFWAHVGGFLAGACLVVVLRPRGTQLVRPRRSRSFYMARPREARQHFGKEGDWGGPWG
jgi:membrane associated rhomboid family serine protease